MSEEEMNCIRGGRVRPLRGVCAAF